MMCASGFDDLAVQGLMLGCDSAHDADLFRIRAFMYPFIVFFKEKVVDLVLTQTLTHS